MPSKQKRDKNDQTERAGSFGEAGSDTTLLFAFFLLVIFQKHLVREVDIEKQHDRVDEEHPSEETIE